MIDKDLAAFLEYGLSIHLGTRTDRLEPNGARVIAVQVDGDGTHVTAFVPDVAAARVLADLRANGQGALAFARPSDERACQVKGVFVDARPARDEERAIVDGQWNGFTEDLIKIGYPPEARETWTTWPAVAVRFKVTALFSQTPGPSAGAPLR